MAAYFGLHVGNSSVCLALFKDDSRVDVIANDVGNRITPAVLQWTPNSCTVGRTAQLELFRNSTNTIIRNKQLLNENIDEDELKKLKSQLPYKVNRVDYSFKYELLYEGRQFHITPREIAGWIFKKTYSIAESAVGANKEINVVITVPLYFSQKSIHVIKEVAKIAGFNVLQVVDEPSTAALGYKLDSDSKDVSYYCLVYRVGGYSIDATILMIHNGMFSVVHSIHKSHVGGALFTEKLSEYLASEFKRQYKTAEITERGKYKLYAAAETVKQVLSIQNVAQCSCESIGGGYDFHCSVSRARFENVIASFVPEIVSPITEVLRKSNLSIEHIKKVICCGGTLKTPKLQEIVKKMLPSSEVLINSSPDEVIATGAALQAGYCAKFNQLPETLSIDVPAISTSLKIVVKQEDKEENFLVLENTLLPYKKRYSILPTGKNLSVSLNNNSIVNIGSVSLGNLEPSTKTTIDVDINKEGRLLLTLTNEANQEKDSMKCDLNEVNGM